MASNTTWTIAQDAKLKVLEARHLSGSQIGKLLGKSRNAVIARSNRLRGVKFPCDLEYAKAEKVKTAKARSERQAKENATLSTFNSNLKNGMDRSSAIVVARNGGARLCAIGDVLGITRERVRQLEKIERIAA